MIILLFIILFLWSVVIIKHTLFWAYLWQIKEYRYDRMRVHFELPSSRKLLLNKRVIWLLAIAVLLSLPGGTLSTLGTILLLLFYGFFAGRGIQQMQNKTLKKPDFTFRASLIITFNILVYAIATATVFIFLRQWFFAWLLIADILAPLILALGVGISHPLFAYLKDRIIQKATKKRAELKDLLVIGITGSYGKSSMKEILATILSREFNVLKTPENINIDIGIARVILKKLTKEHNVFIAEMGAYKKGEIKKTAQMASPQIGILTGIGPQHLSLFGGLENIKEAKYELMKALPGKGLAVFNGDNKHTRQLANQHKGPKRLYGIDPLVDKIDQKILVEQVKNTAQGLEVKIIETEEHNEQTLKTSLLGRHNATNIMGAVTVARELGMDYKNIKQALLELEPPAHTLEIKKGIKGSIVIDDTYSANLNGVLAALDVLAGIKGKQKIIVMQPMIELGSEAEKAHAKVAARIAEVCTWCIMTGKDYFNTIYKEALDNGMSKNSIFCLPNSRDALRKGQELTDKDDVVLLENRIHPDVIKGLTL